ncbi:MAG: hypothetical protein ABSH35_28455 [Isosphaeraceae bacterium]
MRELEPGLELEARVLLSARAAARTDAHHVRATAARVTPVAEINAEYCAFMSDFKKVEGYYVTAINEQSSTTVPVTATVTANYPSAFGTGSIQVNDNNASMFFPTGSTTPVTATATGGNGSVIGTLYLTNFVGNMLLVGHTTPSSLTVPTGSTLSASVPSSSVASAASIFPSFITNRANQMAIDLVQYFNGLPLKLPYFNTPPHTPNNRGAIQNYVYGAVAGGGTTSLLQSLLAIPLPTSDGSPVDIYNETVMAAIEQSRIQTLNGVSEVYAHQLRVAITSPNNRYGASESGTVPSYILASP